MKMITIVNDNQVGGHLIVLKPEINRSKKSTYTRNFFLQHMQNSLVNVFVKNGFVVFPLTTEEQNSTEIQKAFPLGRLKRINGKKLEIVEIQFGKNDKTEFVINFGVAPEEGVNLPWAHIEQNNASVSALSEAYRLYSRSVYPSWFGLGVLSEETEENMKKIVSKAIDLYPEIEAWFSNRIVGKHMRKFGFNL